MEHEANTAMDTKARDFIQKLADEAQNHGMTETWYCVAACSFAACNQGGYVADLYRAAISGHLDDTNYQRDVLKRIKGEMLRTKAILKTGIIYGIPRVINAFRALIEALPSPEANEIMSIRNHIQTPSDTDTRGLEYMRNIFRADLDPFLGVMDTYWPDLRTLVVTTIYGYYQSDMTILDAVTTSQLNIASLVPMDVTAEVSWHMRGVIRNGGTREQLDYAFIVTTSICEICEVHLKNAMPKPEDVINEERLF